MAVYLITYDLHPKDVPDHGRDAEAERTDKRRDTLREHLAKTYREHRKLSESAYAIETTEASTPIAKALFHFVEAQDEYHVLALTGTWHGMASPQTKTWLELRFP